MIRSFFLLGIRNLFRKNRYFTLINILGVAIGLAGVLLATLFVVDEYSFDKYHKKADRIYRIALDFTSKGNTVNWARTSAPIGHYLKGVYPGIENVVRLRKNPGTDLLSNHEIKFYEEKIFFADSTLFKVFDFTLSQGNPRFALQEKNSIVITSSLGRKYFGDADPVGKTLRINNLIDLKITGVLKEIPANSHVRADAFITFSTLDDLIGEKRLTHWGWMDHHTYILLTENASPTQVQSKFPEFIKRFAPEWVSENEKLYLQPLTSIHLHSHLKDEITPNSYESYSYILGTVSLFILLMACSNFINLFTASQISRFKEISIQKMLGASKIHLSAYFFIESLIICWIALFISYLLAFLALPYFNVMTEKELQMFDLYQFVLPSVLLTFMIALLTSLIPSIQAAGANRLRAVKIGGVRKSALRTGLTIFQFSISIILITVTWIASSQFSFLKSSHFGFNSDNVVLIPLKDRTQNERHSALTNELSSLPGIQKASYSSSAPACDNAYTYTYTFSGSEAGEQTVATFLVDENFFDLYKIKLSEGRLPNPESTDTLKEVVINEAAVTRFNLTDPMGRLVTGNVKGRVVGVVENFNYASLHSGIEPVIIYSFPGNFRFVSVKLDEGQTQIGMASLQKKWPELYPGYPLEYSSISDKVKQLYGSEYRLTKAYSLFSSLAIIIAGVGLVGLTTFLLTRKLKEISIRKVFGSSSFQLVAWIYSGYVRIVLVATFIAWILSYYWVNRWLSNFAYKTELGLQHFVAPPVIMVFILLATSFIQTLRASNTNPVKNLREE